MLYVGSMVVISAWLYGTSRLIFTCLHAKLGGFMVFNATFNNISVILWWSVLLVEETGLPDENTDLPQVTDKLCNIMLYQVPHLR